MPTSKPEVVLPELPKPAFVTEDDDLFTKVQVIAYGQACIDTLTRPADGEFVMVPRHLAEMGVTVAEEWLQLFAETTGVEKYERYNYVPAVELFRDELSNLLRSGAEPTLSAAPQQHGQEVIPADVIERYGVPIYEVDFGDEGKERYVLLSDFNTVVTELEQPQQPAEAVAIEGFHSACDLFHIGSESRTVSTLMANLGNVKRFAEYLHAIEHEFFMVPGTPDDYFPEDEPEPECLLNSWGSTKEQYVEQFRDALKVITPPPSIDIGKLRELVARLKSMAAAERERAKHYSVPVRDAQAMHGLARILDEIVGELAALIGDGGEKGNG